MNDESKKKEERRKKEAINGSKTASDRTSFAEQCKKPPTQPDLNIQSFFSIILVQDLAMVPFFAKELLRNEP
jgi:hypothetical protein